MNNERKLDQARKSYAALMLPVGCLLPNLIAFFSLGATGGRETNTPGTLQAYGASPNLLLEPMLLAQCATLIVLLACLVLGTLHFYKSTSAATPKKQPSRIAGLYFLAVLLSLSVSYASLQHTRSVMNENICQNAKNPFAFSSSPNASISDTCR
ncbi:hypothetical protein [Kozakia baliensis]|uniref:hypothetical protein n=1 Tax=Kozakia baliensis TaxID=153496 RepID=UPI000879E442|nr:hypothetical protein [Kozakia baliensis]AOX21508.1 hypothetical protein A0U90_13465 [Kozakia baliensis]